MKGLSQLCKLIREKERRSSGVMEGVIIRKVVVMVMMMMLAGVEGHKDKATPAFKDCYDKCYPQCHVTRPLWCASLCIGKCKHSKSIPDNLCNCTYSCSKFMCTNVGSGMNKINPNLPYIYTYAWCIYTCIQYLII